MIFLQGPNTYLLKEALQKIIEEEKALGKVVNIVKFGPKAKNYEELKNELISPSLFKENKIVILENISDFSANIKENLIKESERILASNNLIIFYDEKNSGKKTKLNEFLKEKSLRREQFNNLSLPELRQWAKKEFEKYGTTITKSALYSLIPSAQEDMWELSNKIKKLAIRKNKKEISLKDISVQTKSSSSEINIFKTIESLAEGDKKKTISLIQNHIAKGDSPIYLFSMVIYQFRNLILIKCLLNKGKTFFEIQKETGLHPFVIRNNATLAKKIKNEKLKNIYRELFKIDFQIKLGKVKPETALEIFIASN